jgi:hypothetical protein
MTLIEALILGAAGVAFLATGAVHFAWSLRVTTILQTRHPEAWATLQGRVLLSRTALADFLRSDRHKDMNDPELSRAVRMDRITGMIVMACFVGAAAALFTVGRSLPR